MVPPRVVELGVDSVRPPFYVSRRFYTTLALPFAVAGLWGGWWWVVAAVLAAFHLGWALGMVAAHHALRDHARILLTMADCWCEPAYRPEVCDYCAACLAFGFTPPSIHYRRTIDRLRELNHGA